ncbi:trypsin-like peptidase domain-containing protein [Nonomuraea fuscirosea]|uniref:trypsin-like peptidase domain-containing protein n=1 Tax=Nonomuraea fuscirosea TaxID=1291556 RepID=UPI0034139828
MTRDAPTDVLLRSAVVALEVPGPRGRKPILGTGFLLAPQIIATCAHVLADTRDLLPDIVAGSFAGHPQTVDLTPVPAWYLRDETGGLDLAFLWLSDEIDITHTLLSPIIDIGDQLLTYGHPDNTFRGGQSATFQYAGPSRILTADAYWEPQRVFGIPVPGGYSGSPVLNRRTGAVCGMLCLSNDRGSAHMIGAADILSHLPEEAVAAQSREPGPGGSAWLATLTDQQIEASGWQFPGPHLRDYLETAIRAALLQSHPGSETSARLPDLPSVYMDQRATLSTTSLGTQATISAAKIFERDGNAMIFGGPGMGKSSLLRIGLLKLAKSWLSGHAGTAIPVRVLATDLLDARPLPQLIASSVEADLSTVGVLSSWQPDFFSSEPLRGVRWMVLIDGLDDIVDSASRRAVMAKLAGVARINQSNPYQFIIASRPLPTSELEQEDSWVDARYELQPFSIQQLQQFSRLILTALGSNDADKISKGLINELDQANLTSIAVVPLIAAMVCQLVALNVSRPLPSGISGIYEEFVHTLASPQYVGGNRGIYRQAEDMFRVYGHQAVQKAAEVLDRSTALLGQLALARHDGVLDPALDLFMVWEANTRPIQVPEGRWREFLRGILRRSGLLTERIEDFVFIHETICDYLAARTLVADGNRSFVAFDQLFYQWQRPWLGIKETWRQPSWRYSFTRFLIALWPTSKTSGALRNLAERGGLAGCEFIVSLVTDGITTDPKVVNAVSATLRQIASTWVGYGFMARRALELLAQMGARDELAKAMTAACSDKETRDRSAAILARLGDLRGADRLAALAADRRGDALDRLDALEALDQLGDSRARDLLVVVFDSMVRKMGSRQASEHILIQMGEGRGAELISKIAESPGLTQDVRENAIRALAQRGDPRALPLLRSTPAGRSATPIDQRLAIMASLTEPRDARAADVLRFIAENKALSSQVRLQGTEILARRNDPHVPGLLTALAKDPSVEPATRIHAVVMLADLNAKSNLIALTAPKAADQDVRMEAISRLIGMADESDINALMAFAKDPQVSPQLQLAAAESLYLFGVQGATDCFVALARNLSLPMAVRRRAAEMTTARENHLTKDMSTEPIAADSTNHVKLSSTNPSNGRMWARRELFVTLSMWPSWWIQCTTVASNGNLALPRCREVLATSAQDPKMGFNVRRAAASALTLLHDPRGDMLSGQLADQIGDGQFILRRGTAEVCVALIQEALAAELQARASKENDAIDVPARLDTLTSIANDVGARFQYRRYAAEVLARLGDMRGNEALDRLLEDSSRSILTLNQVAGSLGRAGDSRGANFLRDVAMDEGLSIGARRDAVRWLRWINDPNAANLFGQLSKRKTTAPKRVAKYFAGLDLALSVRTRFEDSSTMVDIETRRVVQQTLAHFSDSTTVGNLLSIALDSAARIDQRRQAIMSLALQGAMGCLSQIAEDILCDNTVRCWASEEASWLGDPRGTEVLVSLVGSSAVDSYTRRRAAQFLLRLGDSRGTQLLVVLATDPTTTIDARRTAIQLLTQQDFTGALVSFVLDPLTNDQARLNAIDILADHKESEILSWLRKEPGLSPEARGQAKLAFRAMRST